MFCFFAFDSIFERISLNFLSAFFAFSSSVLIEYFPAEMYFIFVFGTSFKISLINFIPEGFIVVRLNSFFITVFFCFCFFKISNIFSDSFFPTNLSNLY